MTHVDITQSSELKIVAQKGIILCCSRCIAHSLKHRVAVCAFSPCLAAELYRKSATMHIETYRGLINNFNMDIPQHQHQQMYTVCWSITCMTYVRCNSSSRFVLHTAWPFAFSCNLSVSTLCCYDAESSLSFQLAWWSCWCKHDVLGHMPYESSPAIVHTATGTCCSGHILEDMHSYRETLISGSTTPIPLLSIFTSTKQ